MDYVNLGRTGAKVSPLCLGCMNFGMGASEEDSIKIIQRALDAGINFLDTADVYSRGVSETIVGKAIKKRRDEVFLATKVHGAMDDINPNNQGNSRKHILQGCDDSLRRLNMDYIDLYQIHRPQSDIPIDETLRALDDLVRAGKVRYIGTSTFASWQMIESLWCSEKLGLNRFVSEQPPYHILDRRVEREMFPLAQTYGYAILPWSPLAGGLLSGKYKQDKKAPKGSRYEKGKFRGGEEIPDEAWHAIEGVRGICEEKGCEMDAFALAWCLEHPAVTSPIIGPRTMAQLEGNLKALDVEITEDDKKRVDELVAPGTHVVGYYEADFGPSQYR